MVMFSPKYFDDMEIGERRVTTGRTIGEADLINFAALTWDNFSLHTDAEFAANSPFGERIAHGLLVLSYGVGLLSQESQSTLAFYGMDKVRFVAPTKIGDTIHVETEVVGKEERAAKGGIVTLQVLIKNQKGETVIAATTKTLVAHRPGTLET